MDNKLTSTTIDQIFEVIKISKDHYSGGTPIEVSTQIGINRVSNQCDVTYQTIGDGCRRRLGLKNMGEFRTLLTQYFRGNPDNLISVFKKHTEPRFHEKIDNYFGISGKTQEKIPPQETTEVLTFRIDGDTYKKLKMIVGYEGIPISEWISKTVKNQVNQDVQRLLNTFMNKK